MTGADSPVIAHLSTEAMPSMIIPSLGDDVPGIADHDVALSQLRRRDRLLRAVDELAGDGVGAGPAQVAACALPRPSATASAKLANSTVNHSHSAIWTTNPLLGLLLKSPEMQAYVVITAPMPPRT